jgi:hypothetical protein
MCQEGIRPKTGSPPAQDRDKQLRNATWRMRTCWKKIKAEVFANSQKYP